MERFKDLTKGFADTIPLGISVAIYGVVYGVLGGKAGLSCAAVTAMSMLVFAGASQMAIVQMIALGTNPFAIIITVFAINLRHYLMAFSISSHIAKASKGMKMATAFFMTDESYAVSYSYFNKNKPSAAYFLGSGLNIYLFWGISGILGYQFGSIIPPSLSHVFDFAFAAAFLAMLIPMIENLPVLFSVITSAILSIGGSLYLPGKWYIIIAALTASLVGYTANRVKAIKAAEYIREVAHNE